MQVRLLVSFCFLLVSAGAQAFPLIDSVGVEAMEGKRVILHRVEPHETYYSIARKYDVSARSISDFYTTSVLKIGDILKVHTDHPYQNKLTASTKNKKGPVAIIDYRVGPKETLYAISKKFGVTVEEIKDLNKLKGYDLSVGKVLKIKAGTASSKLAEIVPRVAEAPVKKTVDPIRKPEPVATTQTVSEPVNEEGNETVTESTSLSSRLKLPPSKYGLRETTERGIALCISDEDIDGSKMLALHRTAPIGTVIKITNPMTQKSTFAKVVGKFAENESTKNVSIVLTKAVADLLGALDKKFQVNLMYGIPNE